MWKSALAGGISKTFIPKEKLAEHRAGEWTNHFNGGFVKTFGSLDLGGGWPDLTRRVDIAPVVVPVIAVCWVLFMVGAMITHGRLEQFKFAMLNWVILHLRHSSRGAALSLSRSPARSPATHRQPGGRTFVARRNLLFTGA